MIRLYDTASREKREFVPSESERITMYVCGPTVYGRAHIGNARPAVVFDVLRRLLKHSYPEREVIYARNITDVDDKIIEAARSEDVGPEVITARYEQAYLDDMRALGVEDPDIAPHATAEIRPMIAMISRLVETGHAYAAQGHVLFDVASDPDYGTLSRRDREAMLAGARVEVAPYKRSPGDFVLWKPSGPQVIGWDSPWGRGRPGWHIECSAMIRAHLGETIDIHGGGIDLVFPHHENEAAQSRCAQGAPLARYWMHNGFVDFGSEKMSKSLGNTVLVNELLKQGQDGELLRVSLLSAHYRKHLSWTEELLSHAKNLLGRLYRRIGDAPAGPPDEDFVAFLKDDLNTPKAIGRLSRLNNPEMIKGSANLLGLLQQTQEEFERPQAPEEAAPGWGSSNVQASTHVLIGKNFEVHAPAVASVVARVSRGEPYILNQIAARTAAKQARDFATADRIRDELNAEGILLEDGPQGTTWRRA